MSKKPIYFDDVFVRHYQERVLKDKKLHELYKQVLALFIQNPNTKSLHNHELKGKMSTKRSFVVDTDCRVIYLEEENGYLFLDIGTHEEVYS